VVLLRLDSGALERKVYTGCIGAAHWARKPRRGFSAGMP